MSDFISLTPEELAGFEVEESQQQVEVPKGPTLDEIKQLQEQSTSGLKETLDSLNRAVENLPNAVRPVQQAQAPQGKKIPSEIPIKFKPDGSAYIDSTEIGGVTQAHLDNYHKQVIEPNAQILSSVQEQRDFDNALNFLQKEAPDLVKDVPASRAKQITNHAMALYNSPEALKMGDNWTARQKYVIEELKSMVGNPTIQSMKASNQVGRTAPQPLESLEAPYKKGATIKMPRQSPSVMGLENFQREVEKEAQLRAYDEQHNMGWKFEIYNPNL